MTPDPKQLAREMAEKCAAKYFDIGSGLLIDVILDTLDLEQLIADKQRLDWLEQKNNRSILINGVVSKFPELIHPSIAISVRQAINNAMKEEQK